MAARAIGRHAVGAGQHGGGEIGHGRRVRAHVGAVVVEELVVDAEDAAVFVDRRPDLVALLARVIGGDQVLAPVLDPFDRPLEGSAAAQTSTSSGYISPRMPKPPPTWPS